MNANLLICSVIVMVAVVNIESASVPPGAVQQNGCYWTDCKSPFTYDYKCRTGFTEQQTKDEASCEGTLVKYQCCPSDTSNAPESSLNDSDGSVLPQPV